MQVRQIPNKMMFFMQGFRKGCAHGVSLSLFQWNLNTQSQGFLWSVHFLFKGDNSFGVQFELSCAVFAELQRTTYLTRSPSRKQ